jgi:hypothetical protein
VNFKNLAACVAALVLSASLTSCAGSAASEQAGAATATSTKSAPPANGGSYGTITQLRDAAVEAGESCPSWDEKNNVTLASSSATCSDKVVMAIYASSTSQDKQLAVWKEFGSMVKMSVLVGENWTLSSDKAESLQKKLGGTVFKTPGK